jgi:hypothetical protein
MTAEEFGAGMIQPLLNAEALTLSCSTKDPFGKRHDERRWRRRTRTFGVSQYRIQVYFLQDSMAPTSPCTPPSLLAIRNANEGSSIGRRSKACSQWDPGTSQKQEVQVLVQSMLG